jgi:hypothetical protein
MRIRHYSCTLGVAAAILGLPVVGIAEEPFFTGTGFLPGDRAATAAYGVSGDGSVVVGDASSFGGY